MMFERLFTRKEFTGAHMAAVMIAFFGVIIAVNATMAFYATRSWSGLVVTNPYVASQKFNDTVDEIRAQHARGWEGDLQLADGQLRFRLADAAGSLLHLEAVEILLRRPSHESQDRLLSLTRQADGSFTAPHLPADGLWVVEILAELDDGEEWSHSFRVTAKDGKLVP